MGADPVELQIAWQNERAGSVNDVEDVADLPRAAAGRFKIMPQKGAVNRQPRRSARRSMQSQHDCRHLPIRALEHQYLLRKSCRQWGSRPVRSTTCSNKRTAGKRQHRVEKMRGSGCPGVSILFGTGFDDVRNRSQGPALVY